MTADVGKDLRLLSEVLLGLWLVLAGRSLRSASGRRAWWLLSALGAWTVVVALVKLAIPTIGLEDWLGFLLGLGYLALGWGLLRRREEPAGVDATVDDSERDLGEGRRVAL